MQQGPAASTSNSSRQLIGSSLLRTLHKPRNCGNLRIPFDYCICEYHSEERKNKDVATKLAQILVDKMNDELEAQKVANVCTILRLDVHKPPVVEEFEPRAQLGVYRVTYQTAPGGGHFWGYVQVCALAPEGLQTLFVAAEFYNTADGGEPHFGRSLHHLREATEVERIQVAAFLYREPSHQVVLLLQGFGQTHEGICRLICLRVFPS